MICSYGHHSGLLSQHSHSPQHPPAAGTFQNRQVEPTQPSPLLTAALAACVPAGGDGAQVPPPWFEQLMSRPPVPFQPLADKDLTGRLQDPQESVIFYQQEVQRRRQAKEAGEVYSFPPFMTTLANMRDLTQHILANRQFEEELTAIDSAAFRVLAGRIEQLLEQKAPYESTVQLAVTMSCMLEVATERYALPALRQSAPRLFVRDARHYPRLRQFDFVSCTADGRFQDLDTRDISLAAILDCAFGEPGPGEKDARNLLFYRTSFGTIFHADWMHNDSLFLYPSFEPLSPQDFCKLGHLPIYPLGMMSDYALNADGYLLTPQRFLAHDFGHASLTRISEPLTGTLPLETIHSRLQFRQLVQDGMPASLGSFRLETAVSFVVFHLFHEVAGCTARERLQVGSFLPLFQDISETRREVGCGYPPEYRQIKDLQAALACLWVHQAYRFWCDHAGAPLESLAAGLGEQFTQQALPALLECWAFLEQHRAGLKAYFVERAEAEVPRPLRPEEPRMYHSRSPLAHHYGAGWLPVLETYNLNASGPVEHIDLPYLDALHAPGERQKLKDRLGEWPPACDL